MFREICSPILFMIQIRVIVITTCLHVDIINNNYRRIENGSPVSGYIHHIKCSTKLQYKMVLLHQDIYTILNVELNYNTKWQSRMLIWTMKENMMMKFIYISSIRKTPDFWKSLHVDIINDYYRRIVNALINTEEHIIPHVPHRASAHFGMMSSMN